MVFPCCSAPCGSLGRRHAGTAPIVRAVSCYETRRAGERASKSERRARARARGRGKEKRETRENGGENETKRGSRAASQAAVKQADSGPSLSVSRLLFPSSSPPSLVAFLRTGPVVSGTVPRCAVPSQNYLCAWPKPPAVGLSPRGLSSPHRDLPPFPPNSRISARARARSLAGARLDLRSTRPLNLSYASVHDDKILYSRECQLDLFLQETRNFLLF